MRSLPEKLSVLIPVFNEERTLRSIVEAVLASPIELELELVCVDDGSSDESYALLQELAANDSRIKVVQHPRNRGKGAAIRTAISHMTGDVAIVQDSDLEYDPGEFPRILAPILEGKADAVFGSRFAASPERRVLLYWHSLGNKLLTWLANVLNDINLTDMETCYKAVRADILRNLRLRSERFGIEPELTTRLAQWGAVIYEVPISYHGRSYAEGKKIGWRDGLEALAVLLKCRFLDRGFTTRGGHDTLESLSAAGRLNRWILNTFDGWVGERVFEAGCGNGNLTKLLLDRKRLVAVDLDPYYVESVRRHYGHLGNVRVEQVDLEAAEVVRDLADERFDTVICVNVLEHLADPSKTVTAFFDVLQPGGHALILVPAQQSLFSEADRAMGHYRRYEKNDLEALLEEAGFEIDRLIDFNRLGVAGWRFNKRLGKTDISRWQARAYGLIVPVAQLVDRLGLGRGLSLVAVARKPLPDVG